MTLDAVDAPRLDPALSVATSSLSSPQKRCGPPISPLVLSAVFCLFTQTSQRWSRLRTARAAAVHADNVCWEQGRPRRGESLVFIPALSSFFTRVPFAFGFVLNSCAVLSLLAVMSAFCVSWTVAPWPPSQRKSMLACCNATSPAMQAHWTVMAAHRRCLRSARTSWRPAATSRASRLLLA